MENVRSSVRPTKKAVLLAAFGTTLREAGCAYDGIEEAVRKAFPEIDIRWAYTSRTVRKKLLSEGVVMPSPEVALALLMEEGYTHVAVLSLHIFPGKEFHDLYFNAVLFEKMTNGFDRVMVARPLLASYADMERTAKALLEAAPRSAEREGLIVFVGHGNEKHPADAMYAAMSSLLENMSPNALVATVQGRPNLQDVLPKMLARNIKKAALIPFMLVAGEHVKNDIAGEQPGSWKSVLAQNGVEAEVLFSGAAANPAIVRIWVDHLREALSAL